MNRVEVISMFLVLGLLSLGIFFTSRDIRIMTERCELAIEQFQTEEK